MRLAELRQLLEEAREWVHAEVSALHSELATQNAMSRLGARSVPVTGSGQQASAVDNVVAGYALRETTGAATALVVLRDGRDTFGDELIGISLAQGESVRDWFGARGPTFDEGVYVDVVSGSVAGALFLRR